MHLEVIFCYFKHQLHHSPDVGRCNFFYKCFTFFCTHASAPAKKLESVWLEKNQFMFFDVFLGYNEHVKNIYFLVTVME